MINYKFFLFIFSVLFVSSQANSKDYFWVEGTGKWHAFFEHWAFESGGIALEHGQVPGTNDDVYFDDNSFGTENEITITIEADAVCRDLNFTRITDPNKKITIIHNNEIPFNIYGSALFTEQITLNTNSVITFFAEDGDYIFQTAGNKFAHLLFLGQNANWNMIDGFWTNEECEVFVDADSDATNLQVSWFPTIGVSDPTSKTVTIVSDVARDYVVTIGMENA